MADLSSLAKIIRDAAKASNVGVSGLSNVNLNEVLNIVDFKTLVNNRTDVTAQNPLIIMKGANSGAQHSITANVLPSLRVVSSKAQPGFQAATALVGTKFATGLTQKAEFCYMKEWLESLDTVALDAEKIRLTCVARLNTPSAHDATKPAMIPSCYVGVSDYYSAINEANNDFNAVIRAREELHASGIKAEYANAQPTDAASANLFVWVPVFAVSIAQ